MFSLLFLSGFVISLMLASVSWEVFPYFLFSWKNLCRVGIISSLSREECWNLYYNLDLCISPCIFISFGFVYLEALLLDA